MYVYINTHIGRDSKYTIYEQLPSLPVILRCEDTPGEGRTSNAKCFVEGFGADM